jgi:transposase
MDHAITDTPAETILHGALELSKNSWLLALQFPDRAQPSLYPIRGGDTVGLMAKLTAARDRWAKMSGKAPSIVICYEAGYDAFWLARFLKARGIECLVVDAASMQVNRRARRAKTDRIDVGMLLRALMAWGQGDRHVWSVVRVPNVDEEDLRRSHRERDRLVRERTAHINRIKGLLFGQGIRGINVKSKYKTLQIDKLVTGDGRPLPPRLVSEITREIARLALIQESDCNARTRARPSSDALQGHREKETSVDVFERDRTSHCRRHDTRGLLSPIRQPAAGSRLSRSCNESSRQRRRGAIPGDLASGARPSARDHDPGGLALAQAPAKECNHPVVCAANRRAERAYPTDHDHCGCA